MPRLGVRGGVDDEQFEPVEEPHRLPALLAVVVSCVKPFKQDVVEERWQVGEVNAVPPQVLASLERIPRDGHALEAYRGVGRLSIHDVATMAVVCLAPRAIP